MKLDSLLKVSFLSSSLLFFSSLSTLASPLSLEQQVQAIVSHLEGVMDTSLQAETNPERAAVRMTTCKVKLLEQSEDIFLYQEQALMENLNTPYRQRFLQIKADRHNNQVLSISYKPLNSEAWVGFCDRPKDRRVVMTQDLSKSVCKVFLEPLINVYVGTTQLGGCATNFRGAVKISNYIILHSRGMDTWDRGFDETGNQVWGAREDSYQFRWTNSSDRLKQN